MGLTECNQILSKLICLPKRWILACMCFMGMLNSYTMRVSLNIAIVEMTRRNCSESTSCSDSYIKDQDDVYDWSEQQRGLILGSVYWGYVISHVPGGILSEKYGGKQCVGLGLFFTALFTLLTPPLTRLSWLGLIALRILIGIGEGLMIPGIATMLSKWVPEEERAILGAIAYTGSLLGMIIGNTIGGILIQETGTWSSVFYFFGFMAIIWYVFWCVLCFSTPEEHPYISDSERQYLKDNIKNISAEKLPIPWKAMLTNRHVWALIITTTCLDWGMLVMLTHLPTYFKTVLGFSIKNNGFYSSLPHALALVCSFTNGLISDRMIKNKWTSVTFSSFGPALFLILAGYANDPTFAVIYFTLAMGSMSGYFCGIKVNPMDLSPNFAGILMGLSNGVGTISGIISPYMTEIITKEQTIEQWRLVFWISAAICILSFIVFALFGSGEVQSFNQVDQTVEKNKLPADNMR